MKFITNTIIFFLIAISLLLGFVNFYNQKILIGQLNISKRIETNERNIQVITDFLNNSIKNQSDNN